MMTSSGGNDVINHAKIFTRDANSYWSTLAKFHFDWIRISKVINKFRLGDARTVKYVWFKATFAAEKNILPTCSLPKHLNRTQSNLNQTNRISIESKNWGNIRLRFDCFRQSNFNRSIVFDLVQLVWSSNSFDWDRLVRWAKLCRL